MLVSARVVAPAFRPSAAACQLAFEEPREFLGDKVGQLLGEVMLAREGWYVRGGAAPKGELIQDSGTSWSCLPGNCRQGVCKLDMRCPGSACVVNGREITKLP
jgi:hypothetical protein